MRNAGPRFNIPERPEADLDLFCFLRMQEMPFQRTLRCSKIFWGGGGVCVCALLSQNAGNAISETLDV